MVSLRCPLCRTVCIGSDRDSDDEKRRRATTAFLLLVLDDATGEKANACASIAAMCVQMQEHPAARALDTLVGVLDAPEDGIQTLVEDEARALAVEMARAERDPTCDDEQALAAFALLRLSALFGDIDGAKDAALRALRDVPHFFIEMLVRHETPGCALAPIADDVAAIALGEGDDAELAAMATGCCALMHDPDARVFPRAVDRARGNTAFAGAAIMFAANASRQHVSDEQLTRLAEALLDVPEGAATDPTTDVHRRLCEAGAVPHPTKLSQLHTVFIDAAAEGGGQPPFDALYTTLVSRGGMPLFSPNGDVVGWRGAELSHDMLCECCRQRAQ